MLHLLVERISNFSDKPRFLMVCDFSWVKMGYAVFSNLIFGKCQLKDILYEAIIL